MRLRKTHKSYKCAGDIDKIMSYIIIHKITTQKAQVLLCYHYDWT